MLMDNFLGPWFMRLTFRTPPEAVQLGHITGFRICENTAYFSISWQLAVDSWQWFSPMTVNYFGLYFARSKIVFAGTFMSSPGEIPACREAYFETIRQPTHCPILPGEASGMP